MRKMIPLVFAALLASPALAVSSADAPPVTFTAQQDHQNMMDQLGITSLRPGRNADIGAPNQAN